MECTRLFLITLEVSFEQGREVFEGYPLAFLVAARSLDDGHEHLTQTVEALILQVVLHQTAFLFFREPVALTLTDLLHELGIELVVLNRRQEVDVTVDADTDEATGTRGIRQWHLLVGGADERGIAAVRGIGLAVRRTVFQVGRRDEVLQHDLLALCHTVELIEVDQRERRQPEAQVALALEVDTVVLVVHQVARQQDTAET